MTMFGKQIIEENNQNPDAATQQPLTKTKPPNY